MRSLQPAIDLPGRSKDRSTVRTFRSRHDAPPTAEVRSTALAWPVKAFLVSLMVPWIVSLGGLSLSVYRVVLILAIGPCLVLWAQGKAGPRRMADIGLLAFCLWVALSLVVVHGAGFTVQPGGIWFIETMGAYLLARCYIRNADDFHNMVALFVKLILCLFPFAAYEWLTGRNLLLAIFGAVLPTYDLVMMPPRMGFWRVQGPFVHPILFGVFCGTMLALSWLVDNRGRSMPGRILVSGTVALATFFSMSSAPIAGLAVQVALIAWNGLLLSFSARWKLLWALLAAMYLVVEFGSTHTPVQFYITHFTFNQQTGWYRLWIWNYGSASVLGHPLFGTGLGDWVRPASMGSDSVDNFWLLMAMRHGLPGFCLLAGSCLTIWIAVARRRDLDAETDRYRTAYLICMTVYALVGSTVHLWGSSYVAFIFLLGAGVWLLDAKAQDTKPDFRRYCREPSTDDAEADRRSPFRPAAKDGPRRSRQADYFSRNARSIESRSGRTR